MPLKITRWLTCSWLLITLVFSTGSAQQLSSSSPEILPTGMSITPTAAKGYVLQSLNPDLRDLPQFTADHPITTAISPDGKTLLVLTSGYNRNNDGDGKAIPAQSNEYIFVYDISRQPPVKKQVLKIANSFAGIAWDPEGHPFYVSGGPDDNVHMFEQVKGEWSEVGEPIALAHASGLGTNNKPAVAGLAVNASGTRLLAVNHENDSVSLIDLKERKKVGELDLRPGQTNPEQQGVPGGEYPFWAVFKGDDKAYVSSLRDREIVVLNLHDKPEVAGRIKVRGQPNRLILNKAQTRLFAALDNSDSVAVIDTGSDRVLAEIGVTAPANILPDNGRFKGSNPNNLALSPDERTLYITNGGTNSIAVVQLADDLPRSRVGGLIPTGWYPSSISVSSDGSVLYVANGKSPPGANPRACRNTMTTGEGGECATTQQFVWQLEKGGLLIIPTPDASELQQLTEQVAKNNHFVAKPWDSGDSIFSFLRQRIHHVIYVIKENRTYDQVLGDLGKGNGDPSLTLFKESLTPNHHQLARQFVVLDNFYASGEVSGIGWNWSTAARATDLAEKTIPLVAAQRAFPYDYEGENRNLNVGIASPKARSDSPPTDSDDELPGTANVLAPDGPDDAAGAGYLWDSALRAGLTVRNYGFFLELTSSQAPLPPREPAASGTAVASSTNARLRPITDPYYVGYDQRYPDYWRFKEWEREFDNYVRHSNLPALELVRLPHDHFGSFKQAMDGVNTVETMIADNDYALGLIMEKVAHSRYAGDTLIFVVEDDAQNGPDHVDAHRTLAFIAGPYVKQGAVISERYNTVTLLRTIEEVLGIKPLGLNDAVQPPMKEVFSGEFVKWNYQARVPEMLRSTKLPLPRSAAYAAALLNCPRHDAEYWDRETQGLDFSAEDRVDSERFNRILWRGMMGEEQPYPGGEQNNPRRLGN